MKNENSTEEDENQVDGNTAAEIDGLLEKLKNTLFASYEPVSRYEKGTVFMSTREVWSMLQRLYPNEVLYSPSDVANWLHAKGYHFMDQGQMRYEWMLLPVNN